LDSCCKLCEAFDLDGEQAPTHQFICFLQSPLRLANGSLSRFSSELWYLIKLLAQVRLYKLQLSFVATEALGAGFRIDERHVSEG
jgi:hypothetical protein